MKRKELTRREYTYHDPKGVKWKVIEIIGWDGNVTDVIRKKLT